MNKHLKSLLPILMASPLAFSACQTQSQTAREAAPMDLTTVSAQVEHGAMVYKNECAQCHGDAGQGTRKAPPLVGKGAFPLFREGATARTGAIHNAMDIAIFATQNMPPDEDDRAEMQAVDYWAVLAFALTANGVTLSETVGPDNAASIVLHP